MDANNSCRRDKKKTLDGWCTTGQQRATRYNTKIQKIGKELINTMYKQQTHNKHNAVQMHNQTHDPQLITFFPVRAVIDWGLS